MRKSFALAPLLALPLCLALTAPAEAGAVWSASCTGMDVQYLQTIGGDGFLHLGNPDGSYTTIKLKQSYFNGKVVCGTSGKAGPNQIAAVCADNQAQVIRLVYGSQVAKGIKPENTATYCEAQVTVN